jgi:hypothetical protein
MQGELPRIDWALVLGTTLAFVALARTQLYLHHEAALMPIMLIGHNRVALWLYAAAMFPGTLLHEISHATTATALGVDVQAFDMVPRDDTLGSVQIEKPDIVRRMLIGLAPLFTGMCVVLAIGALAFDLTHVYSAIVAGNWSQAFEIAVTPLSSVWGWIALYVIFAVSANMFPSPSDIPPRVQIVFLTLPSLFAGLVAVVGSRLPWLVNLTNTAFQWLLLIFGFTLAIDVAVLLLLTAASEAFAGQFRHGE